MANASILNTIVNIKRRDYLRLPATMRRARGGSPEVLATVNGRAVFVPARVI